MLGVVPAEYWEYGLDDVCHGLSAALRRRKLNGLLTIEGLGECVPMRSARSAIVVALKALDLPRGARVGAPLYCCPVVFKAIKAAGLAVCFIDVEPDTLCMSATDLQAKSSQLDAVIAVHMFGNVCDMPRLQEAAQGKPIIEDCAQSLGSKLDGRLTGSFGDIAVFSFRSGKYLSVGEGGALYSSDERMLSKLIELASALPSPSPVEDCLHVVKTYMRSTLRSKPFWGIAGQRIWSIYNKTREFSAKSPIVTSQIFASDLAIALERLSTLGSVIRQQRANADYCKDAIALVEARSCSERPGMFYNRYLYPIIFSSAYARDFAAAYLHRNAITTMQPYGDITQVAAAHYGYTGGCPTAEQIARTVLVIPSYHKLKSLEMRRIVQCLNKGWDELTTQVTTARA
jgi:perosamine synthetase